MQSDKARLMSKHALTSTQQSRDVHQTAAVNQ
jgi:hypothetical protein